MNFSLKAEIGLQASLNCLVLILKKKMPGERYPLSSRFEHARVKRLKSRIACLVEIQQSMEKEIKILQELVRTLILSNEGLRGRIMEEIIEGESEEEL